MIDWLIYVVNFSCFALVMFAILYWLFIPIIYSPFLGSSSEDIIKMFNLANVSSKDKVIDMGSGDGRVALAASRVAREAVGVEINPFLNLFARTVALLSPTGNITFKNKNFWKENLASYDVVFIYLSPKQNARLVKKFEKELAPGTRIVSHVFKIKGWKPVKELENKYYLYVFGKHK